MSWHLAAAAIGGAAYYWTLKRPSCRRPRRVVALPVDRMRGRRVVDGPYMRTLPDGREQAYGYVEI